MNIDVTLCQCVGWAKHGKDGGVKETLQIFQERVLLDSDTVFGSTGLCVCVGVLLFLVCVLLTCLLC